MEHKEGLKFNYIAIEGSIGVGKTTLAKAIAEKLSSRLIMEEVDNPFLTDFYKGKRGAAFQTQIFFLLNRYQQQRNMMQGDLFQQLIISDYLPAKDKIFAYLTLSESELIVYDKMYSLLLEPLPKPHVTIYLQATTEVLKERIRSRMRSYEQAISDRYIEELNNAYNYFFYHYKDSPLLIVNTNKSNYISNPDAIDDLLQQLDKMGRGTLYYTPVGF